MITPARILVPALAGLLASCGSLNRLETPPPPAVVTPEAALPPPGPFVRIVSPQVDADAAAAATAAAEAAPSPPPSPLDVRHLDFIQFEGVPLDAACQLLTRLLGANIVASSDARKQLVTVYMVGVTGRAAIEGICRLHGLWYREDAGLIRILTAAEYGSELVIRHEDETRLYYLRNASAIGVANFLAALMPEQITFNRPAEEASFGHVGTDTPDGDESVSTSSTTTTSVTTDGSTNGSVQRSSYGGTNVNVQAAQPYAQPYAPAAPAVPRVAPGAPLTAGQAIRAIGALGASTIAPSTNRNGATVSIFLRNNCIAVRAVDETLHREIGQIIGELDTPTRQVLLEIKVLQVALGNGFESFFSLAYHNLGPPAITGSFMNGATQSGNTVSFGYLDSKITAAMQLLQTDGRMHATASPMLLSANNAAAEFFSGVTRMITTSYDFETRYSDTGVATDIARPVVSEREIGTQVRIRPSINDDGTITMRFFLQIGTVNPGGATISEILDNEVVQLPIDTVDNNRVTSIVVANHGQSVVMGGLINESASFQHRGVPVLGEIPGLGFLFKQHNDQITRTETVVIITPHIMATPGEGAAVSKGVLDRNVTHPWVEHNQSPVTTVDDKSGLVKAIDFTPPPKAAPVPATDPKATPPPVKTAPKPAPTVPKGATPPSPTPPGRSP